MAVLAVAVPRLSPCFADAADSRAVEADERVVNMNRPWRTGKAELDLGQGWIGVLTPERTRLLDERGFNYFGWWMNGFQGNPVGGIQSEFVYAGLFDFGIDVDLEKMSGARGLFLHLSGSWSLGKNLTDDVGAAIPVNAVYSGVSLRFFELWLEKLLYDKTLSLRLGRLTTGWEYGLDYDDFTQVLNAAFRLNVYGLDAGTPNFSVIPFANWGARLRWTPSERWRIQGSFMNGYPRDFADDDKHGLELSFEPSKGAFFIVEATRQWAASTASRRGRPGLLPGRLFLGAYHDTGTFPYLDGSGNEASGITTVYAILKQKLWEPQPLSERGPNVWTGFTYAAPEEIVLFPYYWNGGMVWVGPFAARPGDTLALAFANAWFSSAVPGATRETVLELAYSYNLNTWISIMPDIQYVIRPGGTGTIDNALLLGALVYLTF